MTGQDAVNVAAQFQEKVQFDGVILTKLDGDARGGAALSVRAVTGKPIKFASTGEKLDSFDYFHPDRMASRILGMGDVLSLIERAESAMDEKKALELEKKLRKSQFTFEDFLDQLEQVRKMGSLQSILGMIPGAGKLKGLQIDDKAFDRVQALIHSMTVEERRHPELINGSRRQTHRGGVGQRHPGGEPTAEPVQADAEDDETTRVGEDPQEPFPDDGHVVANSGLACGRTSAIERR